MTRYYPINLNIERQKCLIVGGGKVAARKVKRLVACNAMVTVISPDIDPEIQHLANTHAITAINREFCPQDLNGYFLVIGATDNRKLNFSIGQVAKQKGILCNVIDQPDVCSFILPSMVSRGDLTIGVSTSGKSPALAKRIRRDLEQQYGPEYEPFLNLMGKVRQMLLSNDSDNDMHKRKFEQLIDAGLLEMVRGNDMQGIKSLIENVTGHQLDVAPLMTCDNALTQNDE